jgi:hypothetical protein
LTDRDPRHRSIPSTRSRQKAQIRTRPGRVDLQQTAQSLVARGRDARQGARPDHPDRQEIVLFSAEDADLGMPMAHHAIERPPGAPHRLRPLMFIADQRGSLAGLMIGLLPRKEHLR